MQRFRMWVCLCAVVAVAASSPVRAQDAARTVPEAWLDSLEANLWRMEEPAGPIEYRLKEVTEELNDNDSPKETSVRYFRVRSTAGKSNERTECDAQGQPVGKKPTVEKSKTVGFEVDNPLAAVTRDQRAKYIFDVADPDSLGRPRLTYRLRPETKTGFNGTVTVDTTVWAAVKIAGAPKPYPAKQMKDFHMDMEMEPGADGLFRTHRMTMTVKGKYLLFSFHQRVVQEYYDYH